MHLGFDMAVGKACVSTYHVIYCCMFSQVFFFIFSEIECNQPQTLKLPCGAYKRQGEERLALCIGPLWVAAICV